MLLAAVALLALASPGGGGGGPDGVAQAAAAGVWCADSSLLCADPQLRCSVGISSKMCPRSCGGCGPHDRAATLLGNRTMIEWAGEWWQQQQQAKIADQGAFMTARADAADYMGRDVLKSISATASHSVALHVFYAPWCTKSRQVAAAVLDAAAMVVADSNGKLASIGVALIDCWSPGPCSTQNSLNGGFPVVQIRGPAGGPNFHLYRGAVDARGLTEAAIRLMQPLAHGVNLDDVHSFYNRQESIVFGYFPEPHASTTVGAASRRALANFHRLASVAAIQSDYPNLAFLAVTASEVASAFALSPHKLIIRSADGVRQTMPFNMSQNATKILSWIGTLGSLAQVQLLTPAVAESEVFGASATTVVPVAILAVHAPNLWSAAANAAKRYLRAVANDPRLRGKFRFFVTEFDLYDTTLSRLGCPRVRPAFSGLCLVALNASTGAHQTIFTHDGITSKPPGTRPVPEVSGPIIRSHLLQFLESSSDSRRPVLAAMPESTSTLGNSQELTTISFRTTVLANRSRALVVLFYTRWCGFCHGTRIALASAAVRVNGTIDVFQMNLDFERPPPAIDTEIVELPTIMLFPAETDTRPILYKGPPTRTEEDFVDFMMRG